MSIFSKIHNTVRPTCSHCNERFFSVTNHVKDIEKLKEVNAYKSKFRKYSKLCGKCWKEIRNTPCTICKNSFDVLLNSQKQIIENLIKYSVEHENFEKAKFVCPKCMDENERDKCSRCGEVYHTKDNKSKAYSSDKQVDLWLKPYSEYYSNEWDCFCKKCYDRCVKACSEVEFRLENWKGQSRSEYIRNEKTVKTLKRVEYNGRQCSDPLQIENLLKKYSVQLGGNGYVKSYWEKHSERHSHSVLAGFSKNNNPYYRTEYTSEIWFTGYATAVIVESFRRKTKEGKTSSTNVINLSDINSVIIDGLNICNWGSSDEVKPDLKILLSLCTELLGEGIPFYCFFDANTRHVLREQSGKEAEKSYVSLLTGLHSSFFTEVPGKTRADEFVLQKADRDNAFVISNDQYRDYAGRYNWVAKGDRLIKGLVADNQIQLPSLNLNCEVQSDIKQAKDEFESVMSNSQKGNGKKEVATA
jgi:hypothetical protein